MPDTDDVLREQLEYLIEHVHIRHTYCDCDDCKRYLRVRLILLEIFAEPEWKTMEAAG